MEKRKEMTRYAFISHMEDYMKKLLSEPLKADTDEFLKSYGIEGPNALSMLLKRSDPEDENSSIVVRSTKIKDNGTDENGKRNPDSFTVKYTVPRKDYTKKMRNLYISLFESNIIDGCPIEEGLKKLNEEGEGCAMDGGTMGGGANTTFGATPQGNALGDVTTPLSLGKKKKKGESDVIRRTVYLTEEQVHYIKESLGGNIGQGDGIAAPMGGKVNKGSKDPFYADANDHKNMMKKSWPNE